MIHVNEAVIVEGKYDKIRLSTVIDGLILETDGFRIFRDRKQMALLRRLAASRGLLILTDSDSAGFLIRNYLTGCIPPEQIRHAYIPDIFGKEKRKEKPSKEGKLGVEGVSAEVIEKALRRAGIGNEAQRTETGGAITRTDLYLAGLSGGVDSARRRAELLRRLNLPEHLSAKALPGVLNALMTLDEFHALAAELSNSAKTSALD